MSDWDFLHDMHDCGYSPKQIADAAACGYNPYEWTRLQEKKHLPMFQKPDPKLISIFEGLVESAASYYEHTGRFLQIWGELGEIFAEVEYGIKRHRPHTMGSDGKLGDDFIEVKTISPEKSGEKVQVKRAGNFSKLLIVRISQDFEFEGKLLSRKQLPKGKGKRVHASWSDTPFNEEDLE